MSADTSRAAFEAWHSNEFGWNSDTNPQWQKRLRVWQASRQAALNEAANCCVALAEECAAYPDNKWMLERKIGATVCENTIKELLK